MKHRFLQAWRRLLICFCAAALGVTVQTGRAVGQEAELEAQPPDVLSTSDAALAHPLRPPSVLPSGFANQPAGGISVRPTGPEQVNLATYANELTEPLEPENRLPGPCPPPPGTKPGAFQQIGFTSTWLPRGGSGLGITDLALQSVFAFPFPERETPLILTPIFEAQFLNGPTTPDLPPRLYDASLQFRHLRKLTPRFGIDLAVAPGWHGDFASHSGKTFRLPSRALGAFDVNPDLQLIFGVVYLDRQDVKWLPAGGLIWTPNDDTRVEAIVPRPRFARRFCFDGCSEDWWYIAGEFGGGSYGIERANGAADVATFTDYRLLLGVEQKTPDRLNGRFEFGYVFWRTVDYLSATPDFKPGGTLLVRAGVWYCSDARGAHLERAADSSLACPGPVSC